MTKYLLREAARPYLTDTVVTRQKHPFVAPPVSFDPNGRLFQQTQDCLRSDRMKSVPFFDRPRILELLDQIPHQPMSKRSVSDRNLMELLSLYYIQQHFNLADDTKDAADDEVA